MSNKRPDNTATITIVCFFLDERSYNIHLSFMNDIVLPVVKTVNEAMVYIYKTDNSWKHATLYTLSLQNS